MGNNSVLPAKEQDMGNNTVQPAKEQDMGNDTVQPAKEQDMGNNTVQPAKEQDMGNNTVQPAKEQDMGNNTVQPAKEQDMGNNTVQPAKEQDMGNNTVQLAKEQEANQSNQNQKSSHAGEGLGQIFHGQSSSDTSNKPTKSSCYQCCASDGCRKALFVILAIVIVLEAIALIVVAVSTAIATKMYSSDLSGRLVAMVILAVTAAASLSIVIYAAIAVFRKKVKPLHATSVVLIVLAVIQAVIAGVSVRVTQDDEVNLSRSLIESFKLAEDDNPRHMKMWATTQSDLTCCGVYSSEDYRRPGVPTYFPPDVPISCCPTYDPGRSELVQERARQVCRSRSQFYQGGCQSHVLQVFKATSSWVLGVTIVLIVFEILEAILGSILSKNKDSRTKQDNPEIGKNEKS